MSFTDDFQSCMNGKGLPTPVQVVDTVEDAITFITQLWKNLSTNEQLTLAGLAALGVAAGIDEEATMKPGRYVFKRGGFLARHPELKLKEKKLA